MKKFKILLFSFIVTYSFIGCTTQMGISNGAYSDLSLVRSSDNYSIKRLREVKETGQTVFGIPINPASKKQGLIYRFNGINLNATNGFLPLLSMIAVTLPTGYLINSLAGQKEVTTKVGSGSYSYNNYKYEDNLGLLLSTAIAIPIGGAINNFIWTGSAYKTAAFNLNSRLLEENQDVDVFLNPKYKIENRTGLWSQKAIISAKVMGATIKADEDMTKGTKVETITIQDNENISSSQISKSEVKTMPSQNKSQDLQTKTTNNDGIVTISYPENSTLLIDNLRIRKNPYKSILKNGSHTLALIRDNYRVEKEIIVSDNSKVNFITLSFDNDSIKMVNNIQGRLISLNYPALSQLYIDQILVGEDKSPYKGVLTLGSHNIKIVENGRILIKKDITIIESDNELMFNFNEE